MNERLLLLINGWAGKNNFLDNAMIFAAQYLVFVVFAAAVLVIAYLLSRRQWRQVTYFFGTLVLSYILLQIAAHIYIDHRPFVDHHLTQLVSHAAGTSFPSDHTTVTAAIAFGLLFLTRFKALGLAVLGCAFLIGFARVFVGIHYPIDILGGLVVGLLGGSSVYLAKKMIERNHKVQPIAATAEKQ